MISLIKVRKLDVSDFVSATRDLTPNFIKLKNCIQKVYDSPSILKKLHDNVWKAYFLRIQRQKPIYVNSININRILIHITSHLAELNCIRQSLSHFCSLSRSSDCGHVRKCVMRSIIFWTIYL